MWLFTTFGFFSIVQKPGETGLQVRARDAADLDRLRERYLPTLSATIPTPAGDYRFRALVSHADLAGAMGDIVRDVTYANFKNAVAASCGEARHDLYAEVWSVMLRLQRPHGGAGYQAPHQLQFGRDDFGSGDFGLGDYRSWK